MDDFANDFYSFYKIESFSRVGVNRLALTQLLKKIVLELNSFSMSISNICKRNVHICKTDLLGESNRKRVLEVLDNIKSPKRLQKLPVSSAILIPFCRVDGVPSLLFTKRANTLKSHRGEVCFPGGRRDEKEC